MKRWLILLVAGFLGLTNVGCLSMVWSPDPSYRAQQLIMMSMQLQQTQLDVNRMLLLSQPTALDPATTSGVIGPGN